MIAFATLFLGLVFGVVSVELEVAAGVDSAKLYLDGREAATVRAAWQTRLDLGPALSPHELVAVALEPFEIERTAPHGPVATITRRVH